MIRCAHIGALVAMVLALLVGSPAHARDVRVAIAANFIAPAREIGARFADASGHRAVFSVGATGQLFTQIAQGAPFEVFLAADQKRPARAESEGLAVPGSRFTYATGRLVLYSPDPAFVGGEATLRDPALKALAVANPATAPYGAAAVEALRALSVFDALAPRFVRGNTIAQTYQFVETGNVDAGLVAASQVAQHRRGSRWPVPSTLHAPIAQDAVLLQAGADNPAAHAFLAFLQGAAARAVIARFGYSVEE